MDLQNAYGRMERGPALKAVLEVAPQLAAAIVAHWGEGSNADLAEGQRGGRRLDNILDIKRRRTGQQAHAKQLRSGPAQNHARGAPERPEQRRDRRRVGAKEYTERLDK